MNYIFPFRNYCSYLVPTLCFLPSASISHIFRELHVHRSASIHFLSFCLLVCLIHPIDIKHLLYVDHCWFCTLRSVKWKSWVEQEERKQENKFCEALQSFRGWCIAFYIGVDQGRRRERSWWKLFVCLLVGFVAVAPNFIKRRNCCNREAEHTKQLHYNPRVPDRNNTNPAQMKHKTLL